MCFTQDCPTESLCPLSAYYPLSFWALSILFILVNQIVTKNDISIYFVSFKLQLHLCFLSAVSHFCKQPVFVFAYFSSGLLAFKGYC